MSEVEKLREELQGKRESYEKAQELVAGSADAGRRLLKLSMSYKVGDGLEGAAFTLGRMHEVARSLGEAEAVISDFERLRKRVAALDDEARAVERERARQASPASPATS